LSTLNVILEASIFLFFWRIAILYIVRSSLVTYTFFIVCFIFESF
jgi:hypothetical protein